MRVLKSSQQVTPLASPFWRSRTRVSVALDYPVVKTAEANSLVWAIFPALFEKDTLQQIPLNTDNATREAGGWSKQGSDKLLYPSPGSNGLIALKNSGECTVFARLKFPNSVTSSSILLNTSWLTNPGYDRFRFWVFPSESGCRIAFRSEVPNGNSQIVVADSSVLNVPANTEVSFAVSIVGQTARFFFNGVFSRQATGHVPFLQSSRNSDIFGIGVGHRGSMDGRDTAQFNDLNFAAIFDEALSDERIAQISEDPEILL